VPGFATIMTELKSMLPLREVTVFSFIKVMLDDNGIRVAYVLLSVTTIFPFISSKLNEKLSVINVPLTYGSDT
jgi:hypothetical protein